MDKKIKIGESVDLPNSYARCPTCGTVLDAAAPTAEIKRLPLPGELSICIKCGEILVFEEGYFLHKLPEENLKLIKIDNPYAFQKIIHIQNIVREAQRIKNDAENTQ